MSNEPWTDATMREEIYTLLAELGQAQRALESAVSALNDEWAKVEMLTRAGRRLIGAVEACAVAERGGPPVNWSAVDESQDAMRDAIAATAPSATPTEMRSEPQWPQYPSVTKSGQRLATPASDAPEGGTR